MIEMSERRETQGIDLVIAKMEYSFLKEYLDQIDMAPHMYTFSSVVDVFYSEYLCQCPDFMKKKFAVPVVYSGKCTSALPENQRVGIAYIELILTCSLTIGQLSWSSFLLWSNMNVKWNGHVHVGPSSTDCSVPRKQVNVLKRLRGMWMTRAPLFLTISLQIA